MSAAAAKEKRERNSGLGKYPDWMVDREVVRVNIHAPRSQHSDRSSAEPSHLDMDVEEPPPQVDTHERFLVTRCEHVNGSDRLIITNH